MKLFFLLLGFLSAGLGAIGVLLPILPTTPFLLLATFCFAKSSKRFHTWFTHTSLYKKHLESFVEHRAMTRKTKVSLLLFASCMLVIAMIVVPVPAVRIFIGFLIVFKYYYFLFRIKTISSEEKYEKKFFHKEMLNQNER